MGDVEHAAAQFEPLARSWAATACETFGLLGSKGGSNATGGCTLLGE